MRVAVLWSAIILLPLHVGHSAEPAASGDVQQQLKTLQAEVARLKAENERLAKALTDNGIVLTAGFHSAADIMKGMPNDIRPKTGWDRFAFEKLHAWLDEAVIGEPFEAVLIVSGVEVGKVAFSRPTQWRASVHFETRDFKTQGMVLKQKIHESWPQPLKLYGDDDFAREMEAMKPGKRAPVGGKVKSIRFGPETQGSRPFDLSLSDYTIEWKN